MGVVEGGLFDVFLSPSSYVHRAVYDRLILPGHVLETTLAVQQVSVERVIPA